jgi:hypothetical protein
MTLIHDYAVVIIAFNVTHNRMINIDKLRNDDYDDIFHLIVFFMLIGLFPKHDSECVKFSESLISLTVTLLTERFFGIWKQLDKQNGLPN